MPRHISLFDVQPIFDQLSSGQLILTPNQRLASRIRSAYSIACYQKDQKVVRAPQVFSVSQWLDRCWQQCLMTSNPLVKQLKPLSKPQEQFLWQQIVMESEVGAALLRPAATGMQAASAYATLVDWQQDLQADYLQQLFTADEDSALLLDWVQQFESQCKQRKWLAYGGIRKLIQQAFTNGSLASVGPILGVGFEDICPADKSVITSAGEFSLYQGARKPGVVSVLSCADQTQELTAAAVWAKQILKSDESAIIAIVIPDLAQQRDKVQRILQEVFDPNYNASLDKTGDAALRRNLPFNFSAGYPLIEAPVIHAAVNALSLLNGVMAYEELETLCLSPFYCLDSNDAVITNQLIQLIRGTRDFTISTTKFRALAEKAAKKFQQEDWHFVSVLQQLTAASRPSERENKHSFNHWQTFFTETLLQMGWPGKRRLDSTEYQQVNQWQQAMQAFSMLDNVAGPVSCSQALSQLRSILSSQIFQPQTADSSLQVLGTLEAAGLQFSHLWLQSMSEQQWPQAPNPNPLIPFSLQREQGMPHATAERELTYARELTERFVHSANHVVVSSPSIIDHNPATVSRLFDAYPRQSLTELLGRSLEQLLPIVEFRRRHLASQQFESWQAGRAPLLLEGDKVSGGSRLFASQSACPFKAFAEHRLSLKVLDKPQLGLNAADRGALLHRALELLWQRLKNRQALLDLSSDDLTALCADCSNYAVNELAQKIPARFGLRYQQLEIQRLQFLLQGWLGLEKDRANFVVEHIEDRKTFQYESLVLQTRIDRIDRLDDGSVVIIDYKTASSSISKWWGERPDEPQLPLYAMLTEQGGDEIGGVAFAQINIDASKLKGVGDESCPETSIQWQDKIKSDAGVLDWQQLQQYWRKVLMGLAQDFIAGKSDVNPKNPAQTCQFCDLAPVCRVNHQSLVFEKVAVEKVLVEKGVVGNHGSNQEVNH